MQIATLHMIGHALLSTNFNTLHCHFTSWSSGRVLSSEARGLGFKFQHRRGIFVLIFKNNFANCHQEKYFMTVLTVGPVNSTKLNLYRAQNNNHCACMGTMLSILHHKYYPWRRIVLLYILLPV